MTAGAVIVHLGDTVVWIGDGHAEWHGAPLESALWCAGGDRVAVGRTVVGADDLLAAVLGDALARCGACGPGAMTVTHPSHWGEPWRARLAAAARRVDPDAALVPVALAPGVARVGRRGYGSGRARCVVLELGPLDATASYVSYDNGGGRIEACEHDPTLDAGRVQDTPAQLAALLAAVAKHRHLDAVLVTGDVAPDVLTIVNAVVRQEFPFTVDIRAVPDRELVRLPPAEPPAHIAPPVLVRAALRPPFARFGRRAAVGLLLAALVIGGAAGWCQYGRGHSGSALSAARTITFGRVTIAVPAGWTARPAIAGESPDILRLIPIDGARRRIDVIQNTLAGDPSLDQVQADLRAKRNALVKQTTYGEIIRENFGDRSNLAYEQTIEAHSKANTHVIVDHGVQVSVDCQYLTGEWNAIAGACEAVVASATVGP